MTAPTDAERAEARFVVEQIGPRGFVAHDTVGQLDYDLSFTPEAAQAAADRRNATAPSPR